MQAKIENTLGDIDMLNLEKLQNTPLENSPYEHVIVPNFIKADAMQSILNDYPKIKDAGSFPLSTLNYGQIFADLIDTLDGDAMRAAIEKKFSVDLTGKPTMFTIRGKCRKKDGQIHTDTESKIISILIYMNPAWEQSGGQLRLLRSENIDDVATEIPPVSGTLLAFKRSDHSWHGHKSFVGDRKVIQMNWVTEQKFVDKNINRHVFSSFLKKINPFSGEY
jgi:hypothetical protein